MKGFGMHMVADQYLMLDQVIFRSSNIYDRLSSNSYISPYEPPRGKTNNVVSEQVRHKPACIAIEAG